MPDEIPDESTMEAHPMQVPSSAVDRVRDNQRTYGQLLRLVGSHARRGDTERVLLSATVAAHYAWGAPTGILCDPRLERLVEQAVRPAGAVRVDPDRGDGRVLHVLSEGYLLGGHTRLAWRWIERDPRPADVALTMQHGPVPPSLEKAAEQAGGRVYHLREAFPTFTGRAEALRRLMDRASVVVLHVHPYDAVSLAAASLPGSRPPIIHENHADHAFWLGLGSADVVSDHRGIGRRVSHELRGVRDERLGLLPLPIDPLPETSTRKAVRAKLGLRPSQVAAVTVASTFKMSPIWGQGFDEVLRRVLTRVPQLVLFLAGAPAEGPWSALQSDFRGRVFPLGVIEDPGAVFPGMDIYLDSFPASSSTAVLEGAAAGLPPLSLMHHEGYGELFHANLPGLEHTGHAVWTEDAYVAAIVALVDDPQLRRERGELARRNVLGAHSGSAWTDALEALYRRARGVTAADLDEHGPAVRDVEYGSRLLPFVQGPGRALDPVAFCQPLGAQADDRLRFDLYLATHPGTDRSLSVRVSRGWEEHPAGMLRLTRLAQLHSRLKVSLPFVSGDDASGTRSLRALEPILAANGTTADDCGDLSLDLRAPRFPGPAVTGELLLQADTLDSLELFLASPIWDALEVSDDELLQEPVGAGTAP
jgi:glycosyltransferase involved in cell wall biosynthesis